MGLHLGVALVAFDRRGTARRSDGLIRARNATRRGDRGDASQPRHGHESRRGGNVAPKRLFEDQLFGLSGDVGSNAVEVYVHRLRKMLSDAGASVRSAATGSPLS